MALSDADVELFLKKVRYAIDNKLFKPINRPKNLKTLAWLGITWNDAQDEVYSLTVKNYKSGPEIDKDYPDTEKLWIFKKSYNGYPIYIKMKVEDNLKGLILISFHIDDGII